MIKLRVFICGEGGCPMYEHCAHTSGSRSRTVSTEEYGQVVATDTCPWQGVRLPDGTKIPQAEEVTLHVQATLLGLYRNLQFENLEDITTLCKIKINGYKDVRTMNESDNFNNTQYQVFSGIGL